jgi:serine/threonine protein kinase
MRKPSSKIPDLTGTVTMDGKYVFERKLGSGSYGKVYEVLHVPTNKRYAFKCMPCWEDNVYGSKMVENEITFHSRVSYHPNVVSMHELIRSSDMIFIALELCPGGSLLKAIRQHKFEDNDELVRSVFLQILAAVECCNNNFVFHRDLKPENILCSEDLETVYLSDFGLATGQRFCTEFGCGSGFYMSPGEGMCLGRSRSTVRLTNFNRMHRD